MSINRIRVELYKLFYFDSIFDLNVKGDSAEFLSCLLKFIHGCFIDPKKRSSSSQGDEYDGRCGPECFVHELAFLNLTVSVQCQCTVKKEVQNYYFNNFMHVINGTELLELLTSKMTPVKFADMWEVFHYKPEETNTCEKPKCSLKKSTIETIISAPFPKLFVLNFNWSNPELSSNDLLKLYMSFRDLLRLSDFYKMPDKTKEISYGLNSFVCFQGAHYFIFVSAGGHRWKLVNDTLIEYFNDWGEVVACCLSSRCVPTLLFYQEQSDQ